MNKLALFFRRDSFILGGAIAILLPLLAFTILGVINALSGDSLTDGRISRMNSMVLACIFLNLIPFRVYMINLKSDRTGRGILMVTFTEAVIYFILVMRFHWSAEGLFSGFTG